jgi:hypothetical protein
VLLFLLNALATAMLATVGAWWPSSRYLFWAAETSRRCASYVTGRGMHGTAAEWEHRAERLLMRARHVRDEHGM